MKRSKFTEEQFVRILQEATTGQKTQAHVCKDNGGNLNTFYIWRPAYFALPDV